MERERASATLLAADRTPVTSISAPSARTVATSSRRRSFATGWRACPPRIACSTASLSVCSRMRRLRKLSPRARSAITTHTNSKR